MPRKEARSSQRLEPSDTDSKDNSEDGSGSGSDSEESAYIHKRWKKKRRVEPVESVTHEEEEVDEDEETGEGRQQMTGDRAVLLKEKQMEEHVNQLKLKLKK